MNKPKDIQINILGTKFFVSLCLLLLAFKPCFSKDYINKGLFVNQLFPLNFKVLLNEIVLHESFFLVIVFFFLLVVFLMYLWNKRLITRKNFEKTLLLEQKSLEIAKLKTEYEDALKQQKEEFVEQLKTKKESKSKRYKMVTVLFAGVLGFTKLTKHPNRDQLVDDLDRFFYVFDQTAKKFNIQKIKTVGDAYMCAGGIPEKNRTNPIEVVLAAFEMHLYMEKLKEKYPEESSGIWDLKMGIHTGPVFCDVEGKKALEIWGDTVNIASRIESSGDIGRVNITGLTYELVRDFFICQYIGKMPVKYQGEIDLYYIEGFRPKLSESGIGLIPNAVFWTKLGMIRFDDLEETVMNKMEVDLPTNLYYHNLKHTIDVLVQVEIIGRSEDISEEELLLLKTAALFHDSGFMFDYVEHEEKGAQFVAEILPNWSYSEDQIKIIQSLIMATKMPPKPKNLMENIICDADLDYLGRADFLPVSGNLFKELVEHNLIENDLNKWNQMQIRFIEGHQYFTETAKRMRDVNKLKQLESIRNVVVNK